MFETDHSILNLYFPTSTRENACLWLIGSYLDLVDKEVFINGRKIKAEQLNGWLIAKSLESRHKSMPDIGFIPGLYQTGIG